MLGWTGWIGWAVRYSEIGSDFLSVQMVSCLEGIANPYLLVKRIWSQSVDGTCLVFCCHNSEFTRNCPKHPSLCRVFAVWSFGIPNAAASHCSARKFRVRAVKVSSWCIWTAGSKLSRPHLPAKPKPAKSAATRGDFDDVFNRKKTSGLAATQTRRPSGPRQIKFSSTTNNDRHRHDHTGNHNPNN